MNRVNKHSKKHKAALKNILALLMFFAMNTICYAQNIVVQNPSFETEVPLSVSILPPPWVACFGTPDRQPGAFCVTLPPSNGNSYIGMASGHDPVYSGIERAGQTLTSSLLKGVHYTFTIDLSLTNTALPGCGGVTADLLSFELYGSNQACGRSVLLAKKDSINHVGWKTYRFEFTPDSNYTNILLQSNSYETIVLSYLLLDNMSNFKEVIPGVSFSGTTSTSCNTTGLLYTTLTATKTELYSSLLKSKIPTEKINDTTWKYSITYPSSCVSKKDTLFSKAYFSNNDSATATTIMSASCINDTCLSPIIPNLITHNGDTKNDFFEIKHLPKNNHLTIYNRWGELIFESSSYQNNWPTENISDGVYYYHLTTIEKEYKGWVEVVK